MTPMQKKFQSKNHQERKLEQKKPVNLKKKKLARRRENLKKKSEKRTKRYRKNGELNT